jgi:hypothetical protein
MDDESGCTALDLSARRLGRLDVELLCGLLRADAEGGQRQRQRQRQQQQGGVAGGAAGGAAGGGRGLALTSLDLGMNW